MHSVEYTLQMNSVEYGKLHKLSSKTSSPMDFFPSDRPGDMDRWDGDAAVSATSLSRARDEGVEVSAINIRGAGSGRESVCVHSSVSSATQFLRSSVEELAKLRDKFRFSSQHAGGRDSKNLPRQQR